MLVYLEEDLAKLAKSYKLREILFKIVPSLHNPVIDHIISSNGHNPSAKIGIEDASTVGMLAEKCKELILDFSKT